MIAASCWEPGEFHAFLFDYFPDAIYEKDNKIVYNDELIGNSDLKTYLQVKVSCLLGEVGVNEKTGEEKTEKPWKKYLKNDEDFVSCSGDYRDLTEEEQWEALDKFDEGLEEYESGYCVGDLRHELPGLRKKKDTCGTVRAVVCCGSGDITHGVEYESRGCENRSCIYCWGTWRVRQVNATVEGFNALDHIMERLPKHDVLDLQGHMILKGMKPIGRLKHISISPPQEWITELVERSGLAGLKYARAKLKEHLKYHGIRAGTLVYHADRMTKEYETMFREDVRAGLYPKEKGKWEWLRERGYMSAGVGTYYSPHWHLLGYGYMTPSDKFERETAFKKGKHKGKGWIYKNHGYRDTEEDRKKTLYYLLSHTAIVGERGPGGRYPYKSITNIGYLGRDLQKSEIVESEISKCSVCGRNRYQLYARYEEKVVWNTIRKRHEYAPVLNQDNIDELLSDQEHLVYTVEKTYWLKNYPGIKYIIKTGHDPPGGNSK